MRISVLTIFPDFVKVVKEFGIISQAVERGLLQIDIFNLRNFTEDKHKVVDDYAFGGGPGMVMKPEPFFNFFEFYEATYGKPYVILTSPQGKRFDNTLAQEISQKENVVIICGRYEGIDERVMNYVNLEVSIGDYVLSGGELPAMVIIDTVSRFVPGVISEESVKNDSFYNNLLDHPHYTRPREFKGHTVPEVLFSGDHEKIEIWRRKEAFKKTISKRPDLFLKRDFDRIDKVALLELFREMIKDA